MPEHPSKEELSGFLLGQLTPDTSEVVAEHIEQCPPCQATIQDLEALGDTLVGMLRQPAATDDAQSQQVIERVVAVVENTLGEATQTLGKVNAPDDPPTNYTQAKLNIPTREAFERVLFASGAIDAEAWSQWQVDVPALAQAKDAAELAKLLVQHGALTKFQATLLYQGKSGLRMGEYIVLDQIGAGGMGQVFKARHRRMDRVVALKVLAKSAMNSPEAVKRFQREVKAAAKLNHSNIVTAHDAGEQDGVHFLVMEYVAGHDLSSIVKQHGPVPADKVVSYIAQAARGLAFAHSKGVVHRDIKPANLLLDADGTVKILDMGLARLDGDKASMAALDGLTQSGQVMGTVDYMAPEQAFDTRTADAKADVYSLGCTVYRLITGRNVYDGETLVQKILAHREQPIPALESPHGSVPAALETIYRRMMAKKPEDRPTMAEVAAELESIHKAATAGRAAEPSTPHIVVAQQKPATAGRGGRGSHGGRRPPLKYLAAAAGAAALLFFGVWLIIRDKDGKTVAEIDAASGTKVHVPAGGSVEVATQPATPKPSTPSKITAPSTPATTTTPNNPKTSEASRSPTTSAAPSLAASTDYALRFQDGATVELPGVTAALDMTGPITIEAWVTPRDAGTKALVPVVGVGAGGVGLHLADNRWAFNGFWVKPPVAGGNFYISAYASRGAEKLRRTHVAGVRTDKQFLVFIDGQLIGSQDVPPAPLKRFRLMTLDGALESDKSQCFKGLIDEVRFSHVARYEKPFTPPQQFDTDEKTLALYHFDEGTGDVLKDSSGNNHHGKIVGATWVRADGSAITASQIVGPQPPLAVAPFDAKQARAHQEAWAKHLGTEVETLNSIGQKMILIPAGEFLMGSSDEQIATARAMIDAKIDIDRGIIERVEVGERPQHKVVLTQPFQMSATEVTVAQFREFVQATKYMTEAEQYGFGGSVSKTVDASVTEEKKKSNWRSPGYAFTDDSPVSQITWNDATAFCQWLSAQEKRAYRLPTEAEWEYACRAGTKTLYSFGDDASLLERYGWYLKELGAGPHAVAGKLPNAFGLFDMHGNLQEWCGDGYDLKWYAQSPPHDPWGPSSNLRRVIRGGLRQSTAVRCRSAYRNDGPVSLRDINLGFRVVAEIAMTSSKGAVASANVVVTPTTTPGRQPGDNIAGQSTPARWNTPAFQQWLAATQKLPAEQQLAEFSKKLMELNPGFDGKLVGSYESGSSKPSIENGVVTGVGFDTAKVADISPVRVFSGLRALNTRANPRPNGWGLKGLLVDLSPLAGMQLTSLHVGNVPVVDLSPIRGMQLKSLGIYTTDVSDLSPLVGMPLEVLAMNYANKVTDLRPLRGMPLKNLGMNGLPIADLSPLAGVQLDKLSIASTQVTDISVLRGMPLRWIDVAGTKVTDLAPLRDCPKLEQVLLSNVNIAPAEISKLLQALPECKVEFSTPSGLLPTTDALQEVDPERRVARWVLARGGTVGVLRPDDERSRGIALEENLPAEPFLVVGLKVPSSSSEISAAEWQSLGNLRFVRSIDVSGCRPTNEALTAIGRCRTLETLIVAFSTSLFNDAGIQHLVNLPHLRTLDLSGGGQTAASLESLGKLTSLRVLKMGTKDLQVTTLKPLQSLVHLHQLDLNGARFSDQAIGELAALPNLRLLNLSGSGLTPAVIDQLLKLRGLFAVSIEGLRLPAATLLKLADHPTLTLINTYGSGIKPEEYEQLAKALPRLTFLHPELQTLNAAELAAIDWAATVSGPFTGYDRQLREKAAHNAELHFHIVKAFSPAEVRQLGKVKNVTRLTLWEKGSSDQQLQALFESLREFPHLLSLWIDKAQFKDAASLTDLTRHVGLSSFELTSSDGAGDASLAPLAKLPHLARVKLDSSQLTDGVFEHLKPLQELEVLSVLRAQQVTGSRLSELRDKPRLWNLQLAKTGVTDAALAALVEWPALEELSLDRTAISDVGLAHLAGCKNLRVLNVYGTKVTPAGIAALRKSLPDCMVWHDSGIIPSSPSK